MVKNSLQKIGQRIWRKWLWLRFVLFQRHRLNKPVLEWLGERPLLVLPGVFNPALFLVSEWMGQCLNAELVPLGCTALDMGTGSGYGALCLAKWAGRVVAVDISPTAVHCARLNVLLHHLEERITVYQGDLFAPLTGQRFDVVLFNPPYFHGQPTSELDAAFRSLDVVERFTAALADHLTPSGYALVLLSTLANEAAFLACFHQHGFSVTRANQRHLLGETISLYRLNQPHP